MAKILIGPKADGGTYSFNKVSKTVTITLPSGNAPTKEGLLLITDAENGTIIFNFADVSKGVTSLSGNTYTLEYDTNTGAFNNNDALQIWYYDSAPQTVSIDNLNHLIKAYLSHTNKNAEQVSGRQRVIVEEGMINNIAQVTTVSAITTLSNPGYRPLDDVLQPNMINNWYAKVRPRIT